MMRPVKYVARFLALVTVCGSATLAALAGENGLTVDATRPGAAINPYIYGQFIEHLGRCIHDGIWAEKLRDRKFLLEPAKSPWKIVKPEGAAFEVFQDSAGAYAGEHCLALWKRETGGGECGIRQGEIGLLAGKEYTGYVVAANIGAQPASVEARLSWGEGTAEGQSVVLKGLTREYKRFPIRFRAGATTDSATLSLLVSEPAHLWVGCLSLMPADNIKGMRADTLELIRVLNPPITRWPGGNFVSGYNWKDAIGERDRRPPRWERAWNDVEDNDFGIDEFMAFCEEVGTEPYIAVNSGLGSVQDAGDEVEYVLGRRSTPWGARRAQNGHASPYGVTWWGVGNEMFGDWQLGKVSVERYALRHNAFVSAMKARNANIKIIAVGAPGKWNDAVLPRCASAMDLLSGHHYTERKFRVPFTAQDAASFESNFESYSGQVAAGVRGVVTDFRKRLGQGNTAIDRVRLAVDEWGIVRDWNAAPDGPGVGAFEHYYTTGDMIATGRALHELLRSADVVQMANWAQTVNVIGAIKTSRTQAVLDPVGHLLALYRRELGGRLLAVTLEGDWPVDAVAAWDEKQRQLTIGLINYSPRRSLALPVRIGGLKQNPAVTAWRIEGDALGATSIPGKPPGVRTVNLSDRVGLEQPIQMRPCSVMLLRCEKVQR